MTEQKSAQSAAKAEKSQANVKPTPAAPEMNDPAVTASLAVKGERVVLPNGLGIKHN